MPLIDVHAHFAAGPAPDPATIAKLVTREGFSGSMPSMEWSPEIAIDFMDERGIQMQLLSSMVDAPVPVARAMNDIAAQIVADHPSRFGVLASIPMGYPDEALAEVRHAFDDLGADGVALVTNYSGAYFGDPSFEDVFAELDRRSASVFVHPVIPPVFSDLSLGRPGPLIEFPMETARTIVDAAYAGVFLRHPHMKVIVSHSGGVLGTLADRITQLGPKRWIRNPHGFSGKELRDQLASIFFDTAIAGTPATVLPTIELAGADHLVFGTDFPPAGVDVIDYNLAALTSGRSLSTAEFAALDDTVTRLFPKAAVRTIARRD